MYTCSYMYLLEGTDRYTKDGAPETRLIKVTDFVLVDFRLCSMWVNFKRKISKNVQQEADLTE